MDKVLFVLVTLIGFNLFAQIPDKIKYDELVYSNDSSTLVIKQKKKQALYDLIKNEYIVAPGKSRYLYAPYSNCFVQIDTEQKITLHLRVDTSLINISTAKDSIYVALPYESKNGPLIDLNGKIQHIADSNYAESIFYSFDWKKISVERLSTEVFLINNYQQESDGGIFDQWYGASGMYDIEQNKWLIEPIYQQCFKVNNSIFCLKRILEKEINPAKDIFYPEYKFSYDIYSLNDKQVNLLHSDLTDQHSLNLKAILGCEKVEIATDSVHYVITKNNKKGFIRFQLFDLWSPNYASFSYQEVLKPQADFLYYFEKQRKIAAVYFDASQSLVMYHYIDGITDENSGIDEARRIIGDNTFIRFIKQDYEYEGKITVPGKHFTFTSHMNSPFDLVETYFDPYLETNCGIERVNDSLFIITDYTIDEPSGYVLSDMFGGDSIDYNGVAVYADPIPGYEKSGVYNYKTDSWFIAPKSQNVYAVYSGFLLKNVTRNDRNSVFENESYTLVDYNSQKIFSGISQEELMSDLHKLKQCVKEYPVDSLSNAPLGFESHRKRKNSLEAYYFYSGDNMGLYQPTANFENSWTDEIYEFVHYNPTLDFKFYLREDSIYLATIFDTVQVAKVNGKINYLQYDYFGDFVYSYQIAAINGSDTSFTSETEEDGYESKTISSIEIKGDYLLVNDHTTVDRSCFECQNNMGDFFNHELYYESENASIWKKTENGWRRISPYYASVALLPNGCFITSSGRYFENKTLFEPFYEEGIALDLESRYFLLDSLLKPIAYLDYFDFSLIEDLGFGISVQLDNGYSFFMTYDLKPITDAEWSSFEMENGKLKAIKAAVYDYDEFGSFMYDENAEPFLIAPEAVRYFELE